MIIYITLIFVQILFGINFVASKVIVADVAPIDWAFIRFLGAGVIVLLVILLKKMPKPKWSVSYFKSIFIFAFLSVTVSQICFLEGIKRTTAINTSILCSAIPLFTMVIVMIRGQEVFTLRKFLGFFSAFIGILLIKKVEDVSFSNETFVGDLLVLINAFSVAIFLSYSKSFLQKNNHWWVSSLIFLFGSLQIFIFGSVSGMSFLNFSMSPVLFYSMSFSLVGSTVLTYFLTNWALVHAEPGKVSLFIYLQPVVASLFAVSFLGEEITARLVVSGALILTGFLLVLRRD